MGLNDEFLINLKLPENNWNNTLSQTRRKVRTSSALHSSGMDGDDVDYEMQFKKDPEELEIYGMNQSGLERFVEKYGRGYRRLLFNCCQHICDFSPLEDLKELEMVTIDWNIGASKLWDMSRNPNLWSFRCLNAKKITYDLEGIRRSPSLRNVWIIGPMDGRYPMRSFECLADLPSLELLALDDIRPEEKNLDFLESLPNLQEFRFDAGMLTTEEIAWIVAKYPNLWGTFLCPYSYYYGGYRVSGYRKPTLYLPKDQKRLDNYARAFQALVDGYRNSDL